MDVHDLKPGPSKQGTQLRGAEVVAPGAITPQEEALAQAPST
jgi:hypothetical protein